MRILQNAIVNVVCQNGGHFSSGDELFMQTDLIMQSYEIGSTVLTDHNSFACYSKLAEFVAGKYVSTL